MNRRRRIDEGDYVPDVTCAGCGRTVPASDLIREHCPQCQEDGTLKPLPDPDDDELPPESTEPNPFETARRRMRDATLAQLVAVLESVSRGEDVGIYRDAARPFLGTFAGMVKP